MLDEVDFDLIKSLFEKYILKSGFKQEDMNFVSRDGVLLNESTSSNLGLYDMIANKIIVYFNTLSNKSMERSVNIRLFLPYVICHEETHATSKNECYGFVTGITQDDELSARSGLDAFNKPKGKSPKFKFVALNEAVSEKLAREILREYLNSTSLANREEIENFFKAVENFRISAFVKLIDAFIAKVNSKTGINQDTVWQAFIRGQREGLDLMEENLMKMFKGVFTKKFIVKLSNISTIEEAIYIRPYLP